MKCCQGVSICFEILQLIGAAITWSATFQNPRPASVYVNGPAKTGHGTQNTLSHNMSFLSTGTENLYAVICIINPLKV